MQKAQWWLTDAITLAQTGKDIGEATSKG